MRAIWGGAISFGLVSIAVKLYSAVAEHKFGFTLLCKKCKTPIKYQRYCSHCDKEVPWQDVVKGLEVSKGKYFIITPENLAKLRPEKSETIDIVEFVDAHAIDPIYYDSDYYLGPNKAGEKSYFLFKKTLEQTKTVAIGRFVMREKEHMCAISPYKDVILLTTLNYEYEIRPLQEVPYIQKAPKLTQVELSLSKQLVSKLIKKKFDMSRFKDTFAERLKKAVKSGKKMKSTGKIKSIKVPKTTDLSSLLKKSIATVGQEKRA